MSRENVEVVRRIERAFNEGDIEAILAQLHPAVEWEEQFIPGVDPVYRGREGVRRWAEAVFAVRDEWDSLEAHVEKFHEVADAVIAATRVEGVSRSSKARVPMRVHDVYTFKAGKVVRRQLFQTEGEAFEAVGLHKHVGDQGA